MSFTNIQVPAGDKITYSNGRLQVPDRPIVAFLEGDGIGVRNTRERLQQLYGDDHSFTLRNADGGGAIATVSLPFHTGADLTLASVIDGSTP